MGPAGRSARLRGGPSRICPWRRKSLRDGNGRPVGARGLEGAASGRPLETSGWGSPEGFGDG